MRGRLARTAALAAVGFTVAPVLAPPAEAAQTENILIANQWSSGCASWAEKLFTFNTADGTYQDLGKPVVTDPLGLSRPLGEFTEAKPIDLNRKVLALWGGSTTSTGAPEQMAAVGIYDRVAGGWSKAFALSADFNLSDNGTNPHSIAPLPLEPGKTDQYYAIAQVGRMNGAGSGFVAVVNSSGQVVDKEALVSAHGVEWDAQRDDGTAASGVLFALGASKVSKYTYNVVTHQITLATSYDLPFDPALPGGAGGHDLRRRRQDNDFFVTARNHAWIFRPDATVKWTEVRRGDGAALNDAKSIDERFGDFKTEWNYLKDTHARFLGTTATKAFPTCIRPYKGGRWIYAPGERVYPEDTAGTDPDPGPGPSPGTWSPAFRVGSGSNANWVEVYTDADVTGVDVIVNDGLRYLTLTKQAWGSWAASTPTAITTGSNMKIVARRSTDKSTAASATFGWLVTATPPTEPGWATTFTVGGGSNDWWLEVYVNPEVGTGGIVQARVNNTNWTDMTRQSWGAWTKSMNAPPSANVIFRAVRGSDGAKAYSRVYRGWPPAA